MRLTLTPGRTLKQYLKYKYVKLGSDKSELIHDIYTALKLSAFYLATSLIDILISSKGGRFLEELIWRENGRKEGVGRKEE